MEKNSRIAFITQFGSKTGMGHLMRCLSLAKAISERHPLSAITFFLNSNDEMKNKDLSFEFKISGDFDENSLTEIRKFLPDLIVFDSYSGSEEYLEELGKISPVLLFDDNNDIYPNCPTSIILNGNIYAKNLIYHPKDIRTKLLLGPEYLVMKPEYWEETDISDLPKEFDLLVTTGGSDPLDLMSPILKEVSKNSNLRISAILGPGIDTIKKDSIKKEFKEITFIDSPLSLKPWIEKSQIVLSSAGSTVYEILRMRSLPVIFSMADNQKLIAKTLSDAGIPYAGDFSNPSRISPALLRETQMVLSKREKIKEVLYSLSQKFDGRGAERVCSEIESILR